MAYHTTSQDGAYAACAIVTECLASTGVPYLCKFAVSADAHATGVADALWASPICVRARVCVCV